MKMLEILIELTLFINLIKSQNICMNNSILTCDCRDDKTSLSCIGKDDTNDTFVDWSTFSSSQRHRHLFTFINVSRFTDLTFTNFSKTFIYLNTLDLTFINGADEIGENTLHEIIPDDIWLVELNFTSPRNFQLGDYAFGRSEYFIIHIQGIQYNRIHNLPYKFNLKALDNTTIFELNIINSGEIDFISTESSTINIVNELILTNCSIKNVTPLMEALSTSLVRIDFHSINLTELPSMTKFKQLSRIYIRNNSIEEIKSNIFSNTPKLSTLDLSNNRIKQIAFDAFIGSTLSSIDLSNNYLTSLETVTPDNQVTSFLSPLNQSLAYLTLSANFIEDLSPLKEMSKLNFLSMCCNRIKNIDGFIFSKAYNVTSVDLSYNEIEFIHPMAFNGTTIKVLILDGNPLSSLEVNLNQSVLSNTFNQTTSFLDSIASTILYLSFSDCTNLLDINWFIITKLRSLRELDLSGIPKTDKFWSYRVVNNDTVGNWSDRPSIVLHGIQFTDHDYCLTKSITHILNETTLFIDNNHECNCFIYKYKDLFDRQQRPLCMSNERIMEELSRRCVDMDSICENITVMPKSNQPWRIVLATVIPSIFIIIILSLVGVYIKQRKKRRIGIETLEVQKIVPDITDKE